MVNRVSDGFSANGRKVIEDRTLTIQSEADGDTHVIQLFGELDLATTQALQAELRRVEQLEPRSTILDLSALEFIDSSGIKLLLDAVARSSERDRSLGLLRGPEAVQRVLEISGLQDALPFLD